MNQKSSRENKILSEYLERDKNGRFLYQFQMVHLLNRCLYHSQTEKKGFFRFSYLTLFYYSNCNFEKLIE